MYCESLCITVVWQKWPTKKYKVFAHSTSLAIPLALLLTSSPSPPSWPASSSSSVSSPPSAPRHSQSSRWCWSSGPGTVWILPIFLYYDCLPVLITGVTLLERTPDKLPCSPPCQGGPEWPGIPYPAVASQTPWPGIHSMVGHYITLYYTMTVRYLGSLEVSPIMV